MVSRINPKGIRVDGRTMDVWVDGERCTLPRKVFRVAEALFQSQGAVCSAGYLAQAAEMKVKPSSVRQAVAQAIKRVRRTIGRSRIETIPGAGYKIPVEHHAV